jgi:hypothetical protein
MQTLKLPGRFKTFVASVLRSFWLAVAISIFQALLVSEGFAADTRADTYDLCVERAASAPVASAALAAGGTLGFDEYLIKSCGFRPVQHSRDGRMRLMSSDCDELFKLAEDGRCHDNMLNGYQTRFLKNLDPRVFSISVYERTCIALAYEGSQIDRTDFQKLVCTSLNPKHMAKKKS